MVEGSQQLALARYVIKNWEKIQQSSIDYCIKQNLDGAKLRDALLKLLSYWDFKSKYETYSLEKRVAEFIYEIGNQTNICSKANVTRYDDEDMEDWPPLFTNMTQKMFDGVYIGLGMKMSTSELDVSTAEDIAIKSWKIVYLYYWISFCLLVACSLVFLLLIRRHRIDLFDYVSIGSRIGVLGVGVALTALIADYETLYSFLRSPAILPAVLSLLFLILLFDKLSAVLSNQRLKNSGEPYALEYEEDHHHHHHSSGDDHDLSLGLTSQAQHHRGSLASHRKSDLWSVHESSLDAMDTQYHRVKGGSDYALSPLPTPTPSPLATPPIVVMGPMGEHRGGYSPLH